MSLDDLITDLVEDRSLDALERLTSSRSDDVMEAIVDAAGQLLASDEQHFSDDNILEELRGHVIEVKPVGILIDALNREDCPEVREFALGCLSEIGDKDAVEPMIALLGERDAHIREVAAEHLALLTSYDFGQDVAKWREWQSKRVQGLVEQQVEDREDQARILKMQMRANDEMIRGVPEDGDSDDFGR